jgi:hypothetical protein
MIQPIGYYYLWRELYSKPIWLNSTPQQKVVLITLLGMANFNGKEWEWKGEKYKAEKGQMVTSLESIAENCGKGISIQNVRTALVRFEKLEFLTNESTKTGRLITIANWEVYQAKEKEPNKEDNIDLTDDQQRPNKDLTPREEGNKVINDKESIIYSIFEFWNSKKIVVHRSMTDKIKRKISGTLNNYTVEEIQKAISNYDTILKDNIYFWTYQWTLADFLQNGMDKFLTDVCFENYKQKDIKGGGQAGTNTGKDKQPSKLDKSKLLAPGTF